MTLLAFTLLRLLLQPLCAASMWRTRSMWGAQRKYLFAFEMGVEVAFVALNTLWWYKLMRRALGGSKAAGKKANAGARANAPEAAAKARKAA